MRLRISIAMLAALIALTMGLPTPAVYAYRWNSEYSGKANLTIEWGAPYMTIAEYSSHTLELGERCITYASATASGSMYVYGRATATGWVTGCIHWYTKGCLSGGGLGGFKMSIHIKFQAIDVTTGTDGTLVEKVVLDKYGVWGDAGTWRTDSMDIWLQEGHRYKFVLYAEVHAEALGLGSAVADFGGIWWDDSRIEWGYIDIPNTSSDGGGCIAKGTFVTMADGSSELVEKIKPGDQVLGFDPNTGSFAIENVLAVTSTKVVLIENINDGGLRLTPTDQPIYIRNSTYEGWLRDPEKIEVGWEIFNAIIGTWVTVSSINYEVEKTWVYDFTTEGYQTYLANSYLLMDKGGGR